MERVRSFFFDFLLRMFFAIWILFSLAILLGTLVGQAIPRREWDTLAYTTLEVGRWTNTQTYLLDTRVRIAYPFPHRYNAWSPDGEQLASVGWTGETVELRVGDAWGRFPRTIADAGSRISLLSWSPDGTQVMYVKESARRGSTVNTVRVDGEGEQAWVYNVRETRAPNWSPDGESVIFRTVRDEQPGLFLVEMDSSQTEIRRIAQDGYIADMPAWSPDGRYIAYTSGYRYSSEGIVITDRRGRTRTRLTDFGSSPVWSSDGTQIMVLDNAQWTFYSVNIESGEVQHFYTVPQQQRGFIIANPAWRPAP